MHPLGRRPSNLMWLSLAPLRQLAVIVLCCSLIQCQSDSMRNSVKITLVTIASFFSTCAAIGSGKYDDVDDRHARNDSGSRS